MRLCHLVFIRASEAGWKELDCPRRRRTSYMLFGLGDVSPIYRFGQEHSGCKPSTASANVQGTSSAKDKDVVGKIVQVLHEKKRARHRQRILVSWPASSMISPPPAAIRFSLFEKAMSRIWLPILIGVPRRIARKWIPPITEEKGILFM